LGACTIAFVAASVTYSGQRKKLERRTTQLRIEQQLRRDVEDLQAVLTVSEERFAKAFNASPNILSIATLAEGRLVDVNRRFLQTTGMRREAVIGRTFAELGDNAGAALVARLRGDLAHGPVRGLDVEVRDREGVPRSLIVSAETIELGGVQHVLLISDDVTERKLLEHQISHARKIETTGRLAGGIAHDFNNLLTVINGYSDLVLKLAGLEPKTRERVRQIRQAGERAAELTRQLLAFSRKQVAVPKAIDLNAVVKETEAMLHRLMPENIEMITRLDPAPGLIMADPGQMNQVLLNLALNARDAMPAGGRLIVETGRVFLDRDYAAAHAEVTAGECVLLAVTDTGTGMDDSVRSHIFEPYFTTKEAGSGTGLGLASVYGIVRQSRGWIWVYSEPGSGTTFKIYFPRLSSPALEPDGPPPAARILTGTETIVLVEDRDDVRAFAGEVLESAGYTVLQASNGASALDLAVRYDGPIHLLLTDIVMPGMDGPDLQARVAAARGPIQVLFMSGYTERMVSNQALMQSGAAFIEKPLTPDILLRKVREVLGGPALEGCL
jgi:PAS domain S-box-containing protein